VKVVQKKLLAPISGIVSKVELHPGEGTDLTKPAGIQIVQNDPLWVEVDIPWQKADALRMGQTLDVRYTDPADRGEWMQAKVIAMSPIADAASNQRPVRLELPNKNLRESGLQVQVKLPDNLAAAPVGN
jgi:multidrug resistance efflux pump